MKREQSGSITVFLSLVLLLILAVIMTTVETVRVNVGRIYAERALCTAMDSVLAEYYLPLFEEYHIFALDSGYGTNSIQEESLLSKLEENMQYTFEPNKNLYLVEGYIPIPNFNLFEINTKNLDVKSSTTLLEYDGELFITQAVSYMKYHELGNGLDAFLQKFELIKSTETAQKVLSEKLETEESVYRIDAGILGLMKLIDGITIKENGIKTDKEGNVLIKDNFVKKIDILPVSKDNMGIENEYIFSSIKDHYIKPLEILDQAINNAQLLRENIELKDTARITYMFLTLIDQSEMKKDEKVEMEREILQAQEQYEQCITRENELVANLNSSVSYLNNLFKETLGTIQNALPIVDNLILQQKSITKEIVAYEDILLENKESLNDDFFQGLMDDLVMLEKYKETDSKTDELVDNYNFKEMKNTLLNNQKILQEALNHSGTAITVDESSLDMFKNSLLSIQNQIQQYSYNELQFDYVGLTKPENGDFISGLSSLLQDGILGLVIDQKEDLSKKEMTGTDLPTYLHEIAVNEGTMDISSIFKSMDFMKDTTSDLVTGFNEEFNFGEQVYKGGEEIGKMFLLQEYLLETFSCYSDKDEQEATKALNYEIEYILMGKTTDYDNLKSIISRILIVRTMMNLISLIGDTKCSGEARNLAIACVGFTGLPALISVTKMAILSVWAFEEALIDITALLQGKQVPLLKSANDLQLGLRELFSVNKALIKAKADCMKENTNTLAFDYQDYLRVFLFVEGNSKKSYRAMDLIQENIQIKYEDTFFIKNCLYGFQIDGDFQMETKFISLPFVKKFVDYKENTYVFHSLQEYSY